MFHRKSGNPALELSLQAILLVVVLILGFVVTLMIIQSLLNNEPDEIVENTITPTRPRPDPIPTTTATPRPLIRAAGDTTLTFRSIPLGFALDYPVNWRKKEETLRVILSPSPAGLEGDKWSEPALWAGIPLAEAYDPGELLRQILADFPDDVTILNSGRMNVAGQTWTATRFNFLNSTQGGEITAIAATGSHNEVGYIIVAMAPTEQWSSLEPVFQKMFDSFRFTEGRVIRPTDATPPPTLTPTPTPVIYVVESGDTLGAIASRYGISVEAIVNRNGLEDATFIRTGQKLIIPTAKQ